MEHFTSFQNLTSLLFAFITPFVGTAGKNSDMFLIPSIAILYVDTTIISFNKTSCSASSRDEITFDLGSPDNKKTLSLISFRQVDTEVLPKLRKNLEILQANTSATVDDKAVGNAMIENDPRIVSRDCSQNHLPY